MNDPTNYDPMETGAMLITGCPRSGTRAVSQFFFDHGVDLGHEKRGEKGTIDWRHAYREDEDEENPAFILQMTLVRDPVSTVRSLATLLKNTDRKSDTWKYICVLSHQGNWDKKLESLDWLGAAIDWWTTVYERLYRFPVLVLEHLPKLKQVGLHSDVDHDLDIKPLLVDCDDFWRVARMYGYYTTEEDDYLG